MTEGHKHREVRLNHGPLLRALTRPLFYTTNLPRVDRSPYPYGPSGDRWYLSTLSILHRWTGLTIRTP